MEEDNTDRATSMGRRYHDHGNGFMKERDQIAYDLFPDYLKAVRADLENSEISKCQALVPSSTAVSICSLFGLRSKTPAFPTDTFYQAFVEKARRRYGIDPKGAELESAWHHFAQEGDRLHDEKKPLLEQAVATGDEFALADVVRLETRRLINANVVLSQFRGLDLPNGQDLEQFLATDLGRSSLSKDIVDDISDLSTRRIGMLQAIGAELRHIQADIVQLQAVLSRNAIADHLLPLKSVAEVQLGGLLRTIALSDSVLKTFEEIKHLARLKYIQDTALMSTSDDALYELKLAVKKLNSLLNPEPQKALTYEAR
jgi:hypothetical protein